MRQILILSAIILGTVFGCKGPEDLAGPAILSTGHGGAGFDTYRNTFPPNTEAAVRQGLWVEKADAAEIDIQMTADSVLVLHHDSGLERSTPCGGCVSAMTYDSLMRSCPVLHRNGPAGGQFTIPRLDSIFRKYHDGTKVFFLNVKTPESCISFPEADHQRLARQLSKLISESNAYETTFIETFDRDFLRICQGVDSSLRIIFDEDNVDLAIETALRNGYQGIGVVNEAIDETQVKAAKDQGLFVVIWGVRVLKGTREAVAKHPDAIMTDDIRMLNNLLKKGE